MKAKKVAKKNGVRPVTRIVKGKKRVDWEDYKNGRFLAGSHRQGFSRRIDLINNVKRVHTDTGKFLESIKNEKRCKVILWMFE